MKPVRFRSPPLARQLGLVFFSLLLVVGCGKELGRVPFNAEATKSATFPLKAGAVAFWTDIDIKYEGDAALEYRVELEQDGASVAHAVCAPLGQLTIKLNSVETRFGDARTLSAAGKMPCEVQLPKAGLTTVRASLAFTSVPRSLTLQKADLVIKQ